MLNALFRLQPEASLMIAGFSFPAFSGDGDLRNQRTHMCVPNEGPIPVGTYYIIDRETALFDRFRKNKEKKKDWFALYAKDRVIDDERYCAGVIRGQFRLHPKGERGVSRGCVTLESASDFALLRELLKSTEMEQIAGGQFMSYGTVLVS
jgi:Protein of unknown function (DUF2778)